MAGAVDIDLQKLVDRDVATVGEVAQKRVEAWVTAEDGLGVFFSRAAYTIYGLALRSRDQNPYVRSGDLKKRAMRPGRVNLRNGNGTTGFQVKWQADSRILNFMKGKNAIYREQFETVSKPELDAIDKRIQSGIDRIP